MANKSKIARTDEGEEPKEESDAKGYEPFLTIIKDMIKNFEEKQEIKDMERNEKKRNGKNKINL